MPLMDTAGDAVGFANVKTVGEGPAFFTNLAFGNAVANQQAMNAIGQAAVGSIVKGLTEIDPAEAASVSKALTGHDTAATITALLAALQSGQIGTKVAQTVPPVTP